MYKKPFILGLAPEVPDIQRLTTEELSQAVGHNTGNLAFHYAIDQQLGGNLTYLNWGADPALINAHRPAAQCCRALIS